jgi:hypothetical protein
MRTTVTLAAAVILGAAATVAGEPPPPPPLVDANGVKSVTVPARLIPEPQERGKPYPVPPTQWKLDPVLWGWTCELPDGTGMTFGGVQQAADDGLAHTQIKEGAAWKPIIDDLRKANPLQKRNEQVLALRNACKDTLARARNLYFEGKPAADEAKALKESVDPAVEKLAKDLAALVAELKGTSGLGEYEAGQVKFALRHLEAAAGFIKPFGALTTPEQMATMRRGQIELEIAAEAFDAEPPPRALSKPAYDSKTKLFVMFGGDHLDYAVNDLWVFDAAKRRWFQRHPANAPEPRFDARFDALGDGRVAMFGGCIYEPGKHYIHVGPAKWIYDVEKDTWTADGHQEKTFPSDTRSARYYPPAGPEAFMAGPRPDAAAFDASLKALPLNTWTGLKIPVPLGGRDWGTIPFDSERGMLYVWGGGHCSYCGNDVAQFHLATGRWEISDPTMTLLGCIGTNEQYPFGVDFNRRPWVKPHSWNSHDYDPDLRKMVQLGFRAIDKYFYLYDPDRADWTSPRNSLSFEPSVMSGQVRHTKHGTLCWQGDKVFLLDAKTLKWEKVAVKGAMPGTSVDACGMIYDPTRDRMLFMSPGYAQPYNGQIYALDFATSQVAPLNPEGMDASKTWWFFPREVTYHPESDLFVWGELYKKGRDLSAKPVSPDLFPAYDAAKNRWVLIKIAVGKGAVLPGISGGIAYDAKRKVFWAADSGYGGGVSVMRFDPAKAEITPMKDLIAPAAPAPAGK